MSPFKQCSQDDKDSTCKSNISQESEIQVNHHRYKIKNTKKVIEFKVSTFRDEQDTEIALIIVSDITTLRQCEK